MKHFTIAACLLLAAPASAGTLTYIAGDSGIPGVASVASAGLIGFGNSVNETSTDPTSASQIASNGSDTNVNSSTETGLIKAKSDSLSSELGGLVAFGSVGVLFQNTGTTDISFGAGAIQYDADGTFSRDLGDEQDAQAVNSFFAGLQYVTGTLDLDASDFGFSISSDLMDASGTYDTSSDPELSTEKTDGLGTSSLSVDGNGFDYSAANSAFTLGVGEYILIGSTLSVSAVTTTGSASVTDATSTGTLSITLGNGVTLAGAPTNFFVTSGAPLSPVPVPPALPMLAAGFLGMLVLRRKS